MAKLAGKAYISLNGIDHSSQNGAVLMLGNAPKTTVKADNGISGYTEGVGEPGINASFIKTNGLDLQTVADFSGTVTFEADDGDTYVLRDAWVANEIEMTHDENAAFPVELRGVSLEKV